MAMAGMLTIPRASFPTLLHKLISPARTAVVAAAPPTRRPFFTTPVLAIRPPSDGFDDSPADGQKRKISENYLSGLTNPLGGGPAWVVKEDDDAARFRMDMPGLGKEDVRVYLKKNVLFIEGERKEGEVEDGNGRRIYNTATIHFSEELFKLDEVKAEMKNGELKISVPKVEKEAEDEMNDAFEVKIE